ncbi:hypothetical protein B0H17DRAFT_1066944 [Mycena rosella]|uniref:DUF6534 domain-containing protein n=1 Tax=Mycena rosella TaxID=1033263 RepID=A0AAD7DDV5_MYCRO|nr:hypothetical protein B0H17DRAFT_1066944 [Mycena rosella]
MAFNADIVMGSLLVGTWASSVLYTIEVMQAAYYYRHFKHDNWMLKLLVSSVIAIDSVSMIANYASVYLFDPLYIFATGVVTALVQSFLTARYWVLTRNKFITGTLVFFIMVATGGVFASGITIAIFPEYANRRKLIIPALTWLITEAVTDISIALALLLKFRKVKTSFKETRSLLNGLVAQTIQTGTAGASIALAVLVAYLANPNSNVPAGIAYCLGRVYCITLVRTLIKKLCVGGVSQNLKLANLNSRNPGNTGNTWSGGGTSSGVITGIRGERGNQERTEGGNEYGGIHVHQTAVVHVDTPQEFCIGSFKTNPGQGLPDDSPAGAIEMTVTDSASYSSKRKQDPFPA